jgi:hypothetical protein
MSATIAVESPHRSHVRNRVLATAAALAVVAGVTVFAATEIDGSSTKSPTPAITSPAATSHRGHHHLIGRGRTTPANLDAQLTTHDGHR